MIKSTFFAIAVIIIASGAGFSQAKTASKNSKRPRVIVTENIPVATPTPRKVIVVPNAAPTGDKSKVKPSASPTPAANTPKPKPNKAATTRLRFNEIQGRIEQAKRAMRTKPLRISQADETQTTSIVRLAFLNRQINEIDFAVISKPVFLKRGSETVVRSERGQMVRIKTIRGNGVNTPVMILDLANRAMVPLIVQYPIEKFGKFREMAYYVSTHPGIVTPDTVAMGRTYVRNIIDVARNRLRTKGYFIQPKVADIAERLALVEHVDHARFRNEYHPRIYDDVFVLYALNRGQTYRYSVSRAGAGGMVQMIPSTYRMVRSRFYNVGLIPDFVRGMRDHVNAAQAMLLYMQMTWNDLLKSSTVRDAMKQGFATQEQLMAAGYNSNPARLPRYIRRGGDKWTTLIPRETKVYLRIYSSVERYVPMKPRTR